MVALLDLSFHHYQLLHQQHRKQLAVNFAACNFTKESKQQACEFERPAKPVVV